MKLLSSVAVCVLCLVAIAPARADTEVRFQLSVGLASPPAPAIADCAVVPSSQGGLAVLDAAVESGCIDAYKTETYPGLGAYVSCVTPHGLPELCQQGGGVVTFWALWVNDEAAQSGISSLTFAAGDELELSYTNFLTCIDCL